MNELASNSALASWRNIRDLSRLIWSHASRFVKLRLTIVLGLVLIASILTPLGAVALKYIVDQFTGNVSVGSVTIGVLIALYVLSQWLSRTIGEIRGLIYARAERRMFRSLSERLFEHVMRLPLRFHLERQTGAINQTLENGLQGYQLILHHLVFTVLPVTAQLLTVVVILLRFSQPAFLAIFCAALASYAAAFSVFTLRVTQSAEKASRAHIEATALMTDSILNYETVKYFAAERVMQDKVSRAMAATEDRWVWFYRRYAYNGLGVATVYALFLGLAIVYAAREVRAGRMTVGDFVLVNTYMLQVMQPLEAFGYAVQGFSQGTAMLAQLLDLLREKTEPQPEMSAGLAATVQSPGAWQPGSAAVVVQDPKGLDDTPGELIFKNVTLSYRPDRQILKGISFHLPAGRTLGIVGGSGAGKSTIVRLLVRLFEADGGAIYLDRTPIRDLPLEALRLAIAVVPQDTVLFNDTIARNIEFGKYGSSSAEIEAAARLAHLHDFISSLPDGYETRVGERGVKLSGGEKQRISIARAAIKRPRIFVFDEATSSLDSNTEKEILNNFREISRCSTTLVIAHRLSTVAHADEILVLDGGMIAERGSHATLLRRNGRYAALWETQQKGSAAA